jgi:LysR family glycine cleavage system transcriptional activator
MPVLPPTPRLPSLNALRAFEAAARLGGFAAAGAELSVSPGAVASLVRQLEDDLAAPLFERQARGVRLTPLGTRALPGFVAVFDDLGQAVRDLRHDAAPRRVHIAALPALAQLWILPRLPAVRSRHPDVDISVTAMEQPPNLKRVPFDLCLFYTDDLPPGAVVLAQDALLPVCTPALAAALRDPGDLRAAICLTDSAWQDDWSIWADAAMPGQGFAPRGPQFSLYAMALAEALNGAGVLMAHRALVAGHLASGALVAPFAQVVPLPQPIALWMLPDARGSAAVAQVAETLRMLA